MTSLLTAVLADCCRGTGDDPTRATGCLGETIANVSSATTAAAAAAAAAELPERRIYDPNINNKKQRRNSRCEQCVLQR